jgi:Tfp pilus assembly protein PilN
MAVMYADLIPKPIRNARRRAARVRRWVSICATYAGLLVCAYGAVAAAIDSDPSGLSERLAARIKENSGQQAQVKDATSQLQNFRRVLDANHAVGDQPDWSILLAMVARTTQGEVVLRGFQVGPRPAAPGETKAAADGDADSGRFLLKIKAFAKTQDDVTAFVLRLEKEGLFENVSLLESKKEPFGSADAVGFKIECGLGPQGRKP